MKYAIIGCGRISDLHIKAAVENKLDIVALCDVSSEKASGKLSIFDNSKNSDNPQKVKIYTDYKNMLINEKPDIVAIATDSGMHAPIALDCIESGCNVIIEKPIALSIAGADEIIKKAGEKGVKVCACHQNRFNKSVQTIYSAIKQERFKRLYYGTAQIRWHRDEEYYSQDAWRGTWEKDGGALMNQCIHNIDLLRWLMGNEIIDVFAYTDKLNHDYIEAEDFGIALVRFANGSYGVIEGTTDIYPDDLEEKLCIFGQNGTVTAGGTSVNTIEEWHFADGLDSPDDIKCNALECPPNIYGFGHSAVYADVIDAIKNDRTPFITAEDGKRALELVLAIYKSAAEGKPVKLPLNDCSTLDFTERFK